MKVIKCIILVFFVISSLTIMTGCKEQEGPAEKVGEKIDKTIEQAGDKIEETGDKVKKQTQN